MPHPNFSEYLKILIKSCLTILLCKEAREKYCFKN